MADNRVIQVPFQREPYKLVVIGGAGVYATLIAYERAYWRTKVLASPVLPNISFWVNSMMSLIRPEVCDTTVLCRLA